jgi:hypothetical protein
MQHPKIISAQAIDEHKLLVAFDNAERKIYDVRPLLEKAMFAPLKNPSLFKSVNVEVGGYAVVWNDEIWTKGTPAL